MILLSIIVPVYNVEKHIEKCLTSLAEQDIPFNEYEIIAINDGSKDNSKTIIEKLQSRYPQLELLTTTNQGVGGARNTGIQKAKGKFLMFVDGDDYIEPKCLSALLKYAEEKELEILKFNYNEINENYNLIRKTRNTTFSVVYKNDIISGKQFLYERMGWSCYVGQFLFNKSLILENNHFFETKIFYEDVIWLPKVLISAQRVSAIDNNVYNYFRRKDSITMNYSIDNNNKLIFDRISAIDHLNSIKILEPDIQVTKWISAFIALLVVGLISNIVKNCPNKRKEILIELEKIKVFPLKPFKFTFKQNLHIWLINLNPFLYLKIKQLSLIIRKVTR